MFELKLIQQTKLYRHIHKMLYYIEAINGNF